MYVREEPLGLAGGVGSLTYLSIAYHEDLFANSVNHFVVCCDPNVVCGFFGLCSKCRGSLANVS
jgi:hypothetical protein